MAENVDYGLAIPESDQEFVILPDKTKVRFESTGPLAKYLGDEIVAWENVDQRICNRYAAVNAKLTQIVCNAGNGELQQGAIDSIRSELRNFKTETVDFQACIYSQSRLGKLLIAYRKEYESDQVYRARAAAAFCVAMGVGRVGYTVGAMWTLAVADATIRLCNADAMSDDVLGYRKELESLTDLALRQRTDYDSRIADFEAKKAAFDADRKKQFAEDKAKFAEHLKAADDSAEVFKQEYQKRIKVLEDTYHKKLQLEAPAEYWDKLAKSYLCRGWIFMFTAFLSGAVVFGWLMALLMDAECLPLFEHTKFDAATIRASLIFVALMSVAGYLIHLFTRIAISSFHLSRDYRERFQLTRVYLALIKDGDVKNDEATRQIVLQSIFSRSDTGLLKGDHALTMPVALGDVVKGNG